MRTRFKATVLDETVRVWVLVGPCALLALVANQQFA
jgi:hypothetical protein